MTVTCISVARERGRILDAYRCTGPAGELTRSAGASTPRRQVMKFGVLAGNFGTFGEEPGVDACIKVAEEAERLGFDSVWVHDHIIMPSSVKSKYPYNETGASPFR